MNIFYCNCALCGKPCDDGGFVHDNWVCLDCLDIAIYKFDID